MEVTHVRAGAEPFAGTSPGPARRFARHAGDRLSQSPPPRPDATRLARGLGWFSISLGVAEVLAPRLISRLVGGRGDNLTLIRLYGIREIVGSTTEYSTNTTGGATVCNAAALTVWSGAWS